MSSLKFTVYADLNCAFCYTLHERLLELDLVHLVDWRNIEHDPSIKYDSNDLHNHAEITNEVKHVREVAPEVTIIVPPSRPNSHLAIELVTQASVIAPSKAIEFRTLIYRSLWQDGQDFSDPELLEEFRMKVGIPNLDVSEKTRDKISQWKQQWLEGEFSRNIPAIITDKGNKILGLPSHEVIKATLSGNHEQAFEEGAFCYLKPKEKILIASGNDNHLNDLAISLEKEFQIEFAQSGELVYETCLSANAPDLVLMDVALEEPDGFQTCLNMKEDSVCQNISVILFSNTRKVEDEVKAFEVGANDFIVVPGAKEVLKARVRVLLRLKRTTDLLEQFSRLDSLTEIPNRREFDRVLEKEWLRAKRLHKPISLILIDVDYFKKYNDNYGHLEGDQALKNVAQIIEQNIRRSQDTVARYGGEEFVVILPDTDKEGAMAVANQINKRAWLTKSVTRIFRCG